MAYVQVPPDSTGKKVDTNTIGLTERQIAIIGDSVSSSGLAVVTTSAGLRVHVSSGTITLSSDPTVLTTGPLQVLTSGPLTLSGTVTVNNTSSGLVQVIPVTSSGVNLYTTAGINVISASSGVVQVLTSGTLITQFSSNPTVISASSGSVQLQPWSTGQVMLSANYVSSSSNSSTNVKSSGGTFYGFYANNTTNVTRFLKIYGTSSAPAVGSLTSSILGIYGIIASTGTGGAGAQHIIQPFGLYGTGGISFTVTANAAATDTGTTGANDINFTLYYI